MGAGAGGVGGCGRVLGTGSVEAEEVDFLEGVVAVGVDVESASLADGVGLEIAGERGVVVAEAVVEEAEGGMELSYSPSRFRTGCLTEPANCWS